MSNCGENNPCAPVNPCDCAETAAIREQGPPGARGLPGGIPVFTIGTVTAGVIPAVTIVQVNPLLYQINFVIPSARLNTDNFWTGIQTFDKQAIFNAGFAAAGSSTAEQLTISGAFTAQGTALFLGAATFNAAVIYNDGITVTGGIVTDTLDVTGAARFPGASALTASECIKGQAYIDGCGRLRYLDGPAPNIASNSGSFSTTITPGSSETAMSINVPFVIPSSCECGAAMPRNILVRGLLGLAPAATVTAGAVDISIYALNIRLDNPISGAIIFGSRLSNLDSAQDLYAPAAAIAPGAHTAYVTIAGQGIGTQNLTAISLNLVVEF